MRLFRFGLIVCLVSAPLAAGERLMLWEAAGEHGKAYLLGSIHMARSDLYPLDERIEQAFDDADELIVEIDLQEGDQQKLAVRMLSAGVYGDGRSLESELAPETVAKLREFLTSRGLSFERFKSMKPWLAAVVLSTAEMQKLGYDPSLGIDKHFLDQAHGEGKPVRPLESADFQIEMLSSFPDDLQELFLVYTLRDIEKTGESIGRMTEAWETGDTAALEGILGGSGFEDERMAPVLQRLFIDRNHAMAEKIGARIEAGGTSFVVVGAGHLIGAEGVAALLEGAGFEVRQLEGAPVAAAR